MSEFTAQFVYGFLWGLATGFGVYWFIWELRKKDTP